MPEGPATWSDPRLVGTRFGEVRWFDRIDSTNRYLLDEAARGAPEGVVAVADEQTAGRGRLGREWLAAPGACLLVSVLLRPTVGVRRHQLLTIAAALAAADAVDRLAGVDAGVKWPNDVVVDDRKLAGILAESDGGGAVVVGMGLNVRADAFPPELREIAAACAVDREELLVAWLRALDARLDALDTVVPEARARSATLGRRVRVELAGRALEGVAADLTPEGFLVVDAGGDRHVVAAGDVVQTRHGSGS